MMKLGPDGTLPRITSSYKDLVNNVRIVKVPGCDPSYKIVVYRPTTDEQEESEKSSEELTSEEEEGEAELYNMKLPSKNTEEEKVVNSEVNQIERQNEVQIERQNESQIERQNETIREEVTKKHNRNRRRPYHKRNKRFFGRRKNNFNNISKKCSGLSNMEEIYKYGNQSFNFTPSPWIDPPQILPPYSNASFSVGVIPGPSRNSVGLLGDHPSYAAIKQSDIYNPDPNLTYSPMASNFQSNTKNDSFICDQTLPYPSMASNSHNNSFVHNQNSLYSQMTSNYPSSNQTDEFIHDQNYWDNYNNFGKNKHGNKQKRGHWNKKATRRSNVRNMSFGYRN